MTRLFLFHIVVCIVFINGPSSGLQLKSQPESINKLITDEISLTCSVNGESPYSSRKIVVLELGKKGQHPLAILRSSELVLGSELEANMKARGQIDEKNTTQSFLRLTINNPGTKDTGIYSCLMFYLDEFGQIHEERSFANVSLDNNNDKLVLAHLLSRLSKLEKKVADMETKGSIAVAFSASYNDSDKLKVGSTLIFRNSIMNIGEAYNTTNGLFTAPHEGIFVFNLYVLTQYKPGYVNIELKKGNETMGALHADDVSDWDQASMNVVVTLKQGQQIRPVIAEMNTPLVLHPSRYTVFSGYLLTTLL